LALEPEELGLPSGGRAWLSGVFDEVGWVDVFRRLDPRSEQVPWCRIAARQWAKNVGWRIDYQIATPGIAAKAKRAAIYKAKRFSDHAPLTTITDRASLSRSGKRRRYNRACLRLTSRSSQPRLAVTSCWFFHRGFRSR